MVALSSNSVVPGCSIGCEGLPNSSSDCVRVCVRVCTCVCVCTKHYVHVYEIVGGGGKREKAHLTITCLLSAHDHKDDHQDNDEYQHKKCHGCKDGQGPPGYRFCRQI